MAKIRKGDLVEVITGRREDRGGDRGKQGTVLQVLGETDRVIVEGVNLVKKHQSARQTSEGVQEAQIVEVEAPIHVSNVALVNPETGRAARFGVEVKGEVKEGKARVVRERVFKDSRREAAETPKASKKAKSSKKDAE